MPRLSASRLTHIVSESSNGFLSRLGPWCLQCQVPQTLWHGTFQFHSQLGPQTPARNLFIASATSSTSVSRYPAAEPQPWGCLAGRPPHLQGENRDRACPISRASGGCEFRKYSGKAG